MTKGTGMLFFYGAMALTVGSNVLYHLFQKETSGTIHPLVALAATYATSLVVCLIVLPFYPSDIRLTTSVRQLSWANFGLGIAIVGLELGFLLSYRAGWAISFAAIVSNVAVGMLLLPVGVLLYHEHLSLRSLLGVLVCIIGIALINYTGSE